MIILCIDRSTLRSVRNKRLNPDIFTKVKIGTLHINIGSSSTMHIYGNKEHLLDITHMHNEAIVPPHLFSCKAEEDRICPTR